MFGDSCYRYRKNRKEVFLREPVLCVTLLCFMLDAIKKNYSMFRSSRKARKSKMVDQKTEVVLVFIELVKLIKHIYNEYSS